MLAVAEVARILGHQASPKSGDFGYQRPCEMGFRRAERVARKEGRDVLAFFNPGPLDLVILAMLAIPGIIAVVLVVIFARRPSSTTRPVDPSMMTNCSACGHWISRAAVSCPQCGHPNQPQP